MEADDLPGINNYGDIMFDNQGFYRNIEVNKASFYDTYQELPVVELTISDIVDNLESRY